MIVKTRKKLIEVALPLEVINAASAREKSIRHGHPSTLHLWWARRPLAAARAVIFAQMVDDPSAYVDTLLGIQNTRRAAEREFKKRRELWAKRKMECATRADVPEPGPEPTLENCAADIERQRLFRIIEDLVKWENTTNEQVLKKATDEIWQSWRRACADNAGHPRARELFDRNKLPAFHDPFAGGGALPLEAQRLGLEAHAADLNPVAVFINKAMIEIPPRFAGRSPVNPDATKNNDLLGRAWSGARGIAEDVRYYGQWMRSEAEKRIGDLYPKITVTVEMAKKRPDLKPYVGQDLTVIAWLWARTVKSPNPAFAHVEVPLISTFMLSTKPGKEVAVAPVVEKNGYRFTVQVGRPKDLVAAKAGTKLGRGANFQCIMSGSPISGDYIKDEGRSGRIDARLMAIVAEGARGRVYLDPTTEHENAAGKAKPHWMPDVTISGSTQYLGVKPYGIETFDQLFTRRQLVALTTFSDLIQDVRAQVRSDAATGSIVQNDKPAPDGEDFADAYADAVSVYLACAVSRSADFWCSMCIWANQPKNELVTHLFGRQAIPMAWDYGEVNPFSDSGGNFLKNLEYVIRGIELLPAGVPCTAVQQDAATSELGSNRVISTDPPYYDNVPYGDLSDYFYVWLRRSQRSIYPDLFSTLAVPKTEELVAFAYRHKNGRAGAEAFFLEGMAKAMHKLAEKSHPAFPLSIYYAFKQTEGDGDGGTASTGWETFLEAIISAGFSIDGTWPVRTERSGRLRETDSNALASSIVLICRPRPSNASTFTRREFLASLKAELPPALAYLQRGNIAPVDLAQAAIGPGMAVYTRYARVLHADGKTVSVQEALKLINAILDEALAEQEGDFDADSRWALAWFEQNGFNEGDYGVAEVLSKAKNTSVAGLSESGIVESKRGKVRLLRPDELLDDWNPDKGARLSAWEVVHQLIRILGAGGESAAAVVIAKLGSNAEVARELAYRLYNTSNNKKRAAEALAYNGLVQSFPQIMLLAREAAATADPAQAEMFV